MTQQLEPGIYINIFLVIMPEEPVLFTVAQRSHFQDLRSLRKHIQDEGWNARIYAHDDKVYGYGIERDNLVQDGFQEEWLSLANYPQLTAHLIEEGFHEVLKTEGYEPRMSKGRLITFPSSTFTFAANGKFKVYQGYALKSPFCWDHFLEKLAFGLVVDVTWAIRDQHEQPLNMHQVAQYNAATQVAQIQGEYLPGGARINTEVARQRLQEQILPFVQAHAQFELPCGVTAQLSPRPIRIIIGGNEA